MAAEQGLSVLQLAFTIAKLFFKSNIVCNLPFTYLLLHVNCLRLPAISGVHQY